jgi:hypothetical protein
VIERNAKSVNAGDKAGSIAVLQPLLMKFRGSDLTVILASIGRKGEGWIARIAYTRIAYT